MQARIVPCAFKVAAEDRAAHRQTNDWRHNWASEKVAGGHLRWPSFQLVLAAQNRCSNMYGWHVLPLFLSSLGDLVGSSLLVTHFGSRLATLGLTSLAEVCF